MPNSNSKHFQVLTHPRAARPPAHRWILSAPAQLQLCQLGRLGQRRKRIESKGFPWLPLQNIVWGSKQTDKFSVLSVSILLLLFNFILCSSSVFLKMLTVSWTKISSCLDPTKVPEQGHLPHSCRIPHISPHHQLSKVQTPSSWLWACLAGPSCSQDCCRNWE